MESTTPCNDFPIASELTIVAYFGVGELNYKLQGQIKESLRNYYQIEKINLPWQNKNGGVNGGRWLLKKVIIEGIYFMYLSLNQYNH